MSGLFRLSDEAWAAIEPHLPRNQLGARRVDDRRVISGIIHVVRSGCPWRQCPPDCGPHTTIYDRFNLWSSKGVCKRIFETLVAGSWIPETVSMDASCVKAHRSAHGGKGGEGAGRRPLAGRPDHQATRVDGRSRPSGRARALTRRLRRHPHGRRPAGPLRPHEATDRRSRLRCRRPASNAPRGRNHRRHPKPAKPEEPNPPRPAPPSGSMARRGRLLPPRGLPPHRHPPRQARGELPLRRLPHRSRRILVLVEFDPIGPPATRAVGSHARPCPAVRRQAWV